MWSTYGHTQTIGTCVAGEVKTGILDTHTNNVVSVLTHTDDRQARKMRRWWCKNGHARHTQIVWSTYGHTQTIGKQDTCVAGGVKAGILDTRE
jgi:hypothetical protein